MAEPGAYDAGSVAARLGADFERIGFDQYDRALEAARRQKNVETELKGDFDSRAFDEYERALARAEARAGRRDAYRASLGGDFDARAFNAAESAMRRHEREQARLIRSNDEVGRSMGRVSRAARSLLPDLQFGTRVPVYKIVAIATAIASIIPPVVALGGALGPVVGLLGALPGLAITGIGALVTGSLGLRGISDAIGEAWDGQIKAAKTATDTSKVAEQSAEQVRSAEERLTDANRSAREAQDELNEAREEATRRLEDMRAENERATLAERGSTLSLRQARQELARLIQTGATSMEIREARQRLAEAELDLSDAQRESTRSREDLAVAERGGVREMPEMVAARRQLAQANRNVDEAQRDLARASRDAAQGLAEGSSAAQSMQEKMNELSPAGQRFVRLIESRFFPLFKELRNEAQEGLLPGLGRGLVAAERNFPVLQRMVRGYSDALGDAAEQQGRLWGSPAQGRDMGLIFGQGERLIRRSADASIDWERGLTHVAVAADPLLDWAGDMNVELADMFENWAESNRESGKLERFFERATRKTELVVEALWDFGRGLVNIGAIGARAWGDDLLGSINDAAEGFRDWTESVRGQRDIEDYFRRWRRRWGEIGDAVKGVWERYRQLRREGEEPFDALVEALAEAFSKAMPKIANNIARQVPEIVGAFVQGWLAADTWGKLLVAGWLLAKFGGLGAFLGLGRRAAASMGAGMAGPAAAGGLRAGLMAGIRAWGPGLGALLAVEIGSKLDQGVRLLTPSLLSPKLGQPGGGQDLTKDELRQMRELRRLADQGQLSMARLRREAVSWGGVRFLPRGFRQDFLRAARDTDRLRNEFGRMRSGAVLDIRELRKVTADNARAIARSLGTNSKAGREALNTNFRLGLRTVERFMRNGTISSRRGMREIRRLLEQNSHRGAVEMGANFNRAERSIARMMSRGGRLTRRGMAYMKEVMADEMRYFGFTEEQVKRSLNLTRAGERRDPLTGKSPETLGGHAGGGFLGRAGERGKDLVHAVLGRGEAVLNFFQQRVVNAALSRMGIRGLRDLFARTSGTRHHMASGGVAGGDGASIADFYPPAGAYQGGGIVELLHPFNDPAGHGGANSHLHIAMLNIRALVALGRKLQRAGWLVGEHPAFGGVSGVHDPQDYHYTSQAIDVNWPNAAQEAAKINALLPLLQRGRIADIAGAAVRRLPRLLVGPGAGPHADSIQATLDIQRMMAQRRLDQAGNAASVAGAGISADGNVERVFARVAKRLSSSRVATLALGMAGYAESGMRDLAYGDASSQGALQLLASTAQGLGVSPHDEGAIASLFLTRGFWGKGGANELAAQGLPAHMVAQNVQGSATADGSNYEAQETPARGWMSRFGLASGGFAGLPFAGFFQGGGFVGGRGMMTGAGTRFRDRSFSAIDRVNKRIEGLGRRYELTNRRFELSEEEFISEGDEDTPPSLNQEAISRRLAELDQLIAIRRDITNAYAQLVRYIDGLLEVYRTMRSRLERTVARLRRRLGRLRGRKGKEAKRSRDATQERLDAYQGSLTGVNEQIGKLGPQLDDARYERDSSEIDWQELVNERQPLFGGGAGLTLPEWEPGEGEGGTAEEIARAAAEQFAAFQASRAELFGSHGSNFVLSSQLASALADPSQQAAGMRYWGAFGGGGPAGVMPAALSRGGDTIINQEFNFGGGPADELTFSQGVAREMKAAMG